MTTEGKFRINKGAIWAVAVIAVVVIAFGIAFAVECEKPVSMDKLPVSAQSFMARYYPDSDVALVKKKIDDLEVTYTAVFVDGTQVAFRGNGEWKKVEGRIKSLPSDMVPVQISVYINQTFPEARITGLEHKRRVYEVELDNRIELEFDDRNFVLVDYDD